ncbi:Arylsulfatase [Sedimentisphaera cyanobacteriorum]|uniref:Arylsulfatase n=1 Tax=Sedimentisphaera cyanobacteriorum TaxID=1940790 RepID=A0A1Q2HME8_9BACT|nr:arylsulfatase [Sedimentisphaera cyanobacteriorum]AQQ08540.1 Arylsulfatase [Sedimentisphaera cyanobacteriorum]
MNENKLYKNSKYQNVSRRNFLRTAASFAAGSSLAANFMQSRVFAGQEKTKSKPNVIFIMADDIGYSDLAAYGQEYFPTPNTTKLAKQGIQLTDAYSNAAVCTPTRYSVLTGTCPFRKYHTSHVMFNGEPMIIGKDEYNIAKMFKQQGYKTGVVGKWHLGLGKQLPRDINNPGFGPNDIGFDKSYIVPDGHNMKPKYYIEDGEIQGGTKPPFESKIKILDRYGYKLVRHIPKGKWENRRKDDEIGARLVQKAEEFIEQNSENPFFLYFPTCSIHFPIAPDKRFEGKSGIGKHGDFVMQFDWTIGRIMQTLDRLGLAENTLLIVTSDNGGYRNSNAHSSCKEDYRPAAPWRGHKATAYEGGLRVPFIARMPGAIPRAEVSSEPIMLSDMAATFAALTGYTLKPDQALDSFNILPALTAKSSKNEIRPYIIGGDRALNSLGLREGKWKLVYYPDKDKMELYNLEDDPQEKNNLAAKFPEILWRMRALLETHFTSGSSRKGAEGKRKTLSEILQEKQERNKLIEEKFGSAGSDNKEGEPLMRKPAAQIKQTPQLSLEIGAVLFADRDYKVRNLPYVLKRANFVRTDMDGTKTIVCKKGGMVHFLTPRPHRNKDSQSRRLEMQGFEKVDIPEFKFFTERDSNHCTLYQKNCKDGEKLEFGKWAVPVFFDK